MADGYVSFKFGINIEMAIGSPIVIRLRRDELTPGADKEPDGTLYDGDECLIANDVPISVIWTKIKELFPQETEQQSFIRTTWLITDASKNRAINLEDRKKNAFNQLIALDEKIRERLGYSVEADLFRRAMTEKTKKKTKKPKYDPESRRSMDTMSRRDTIVMVGVVHEWSSGLLSSTTGRLYMQVTIDALNPLLDSFMKDVAQQLSR